MGTGGNDNAACLAVGKIVGIHGVRGELKVELLTDVPGRFEPGAWLLIGSHEQSRPVQVVSSRPYRTGLLVQLTGINDRNAAELHRAEYLLIREADAAPLAAHENYIHDLIGLTVTTSSGEALGVLAEVLTSPANDVYVVQTGTGELLIPALQSVVLRVDLPSRSMIVDLPEGL
jgi:16S rRNA processing protein RimM